MVGWLLVAVAGTAGLLRGRGRGRGRGYGWGCPRQRHVNKLIRGALTVFQISTGTRPSVPGPTAGVRQRPAMNTTPIIVANTEAIKVLARCHGVVHDGGVYVKQCGEKLNALSPVLESTWGIGATDVLDDDLADREAPQGCAVVHVGCCVMLLGFGRKHGFVLTKTDHCSDCEMNSLLD